MFRRIVLIGGAGMIGAASLAVVQIRVGSLFGVSGALDAFFIGAALPSILLAIGAAAIGSLVVPRLPRDDPGATAAAAGRMAVRAALIGLAAAAAVVLLAPLIVDVIGPGLDSDVAHQATRVLRIYALSVPGTAVAFVFASYGYVSGRVWTSGLSTSVYALAWLLLLFIPAFTGSVERATLAGLIATAVQLSAAFAIASAGRPRPWPVLRGLGIGHAGLVAVGSVLAATIVARSSLLLDPVYGSLLPEGSVSQLSYASRIAALAIFACGQGAAFSLLIAGSERNERTSASWGVGIVAPLLFSTSATVVLLIAGPRLTELVLARGELGLGDGRAIGHLLQLWAPAVIPFTLVWALEALLYAERRTNPVLYRALAGLVVNAAASGLLVLALGIDGRPLGVFAGITVQLALLLYLFRADERVAALRSAATARLAALHALAVLAATAVTYLALREAGSPDLGACLSVGIAGGISLAFLRAYGASHSLPAHVSADEPAAEPRLGV